MAERFEAVQVSPEVLTRMLRRTIPGIPENYVAAEVRFIPGDREYRITFRDSSGWPKTLMGKPVVVDPTMETPEVTLTEPVVTEHTAHLVVFGAAGERIYMGDWVTTRDDGLVYRAVANRDDPNKCVVAMNDAEKGRTVHI